LPRQTEHTRQDCTLPDPELNPLHNPLLGQHMGRWAEVYFTAAPEHREAAVLALLQELRSETAAKPAHSFPEPIAKEPEFAERSVAELVDPFQGGRPGILPDPDEIERIRVERVQEKFVTCQSCGRRVPNLQKFCGMCGAPMRAEVPSAYVNHNDINQEGLAAEEFYPVDADHLRETLFSLGGNVPVSDEPVPYRYRIYVGAALIILIAALVIMAYRGTQNWSGSSYSLPQAAPSAEPQPAAQPAAKPATGAGAHVGDDGRVGAHADGKVEPRAETQKSLASATQPPPIVRNTESATPDAPSAATGQGSGSEELLVAERYLNGRYGNARHTDEAARWLWQAVGKQNAAAALLLSDLYMRGDGVPKNCDQARLLLDAAARKGVAGAGQRLRNLQAFGCQ